MKPLNKQTIFLPSERCSVDEFNTITLPNGTKISGTEGYFLTPSEMEEFIGEVFDEGADIGVDAYIQSSSTNDTEKMYEFKKQELIKQLLQ